MNKRKINILKLFPTPFYSPLSLNNYTRARAFIDLGCELNILTFPHGENITYENLNVIRFPKKHMFKNLEGGDYLKIGIYSLLSFLKFILLKKRKYNLIFAYGTMYLLVWLIKPFIKTPVYATVYTNLPDELLKWSVTKNKFFIDFSRKYEIFCLKKYSKVIVQSEKQYNYYKMHGLKEDRLILIKHSIITENNRIINKKDISSGDPVFNVTYAGSFVPIQNISLLYETVSLLKNSNVIFNLIGATEEEIENEKINIIAKENGNIKIYRRMDPEELKYYIEKADVLVSPRIFGFDTPIKIFDYLSKGKCILATDRPIHNTVLNKDIAYLTEPTAEKFADAILYLKENRQIMLNFGKKALEYFNHNYSFEKMKENYSKLF